MRPWPLLLIPLFALASAAQDTASTKQATSTVTGHVYCADTNAPARLATVMLEPVRALDNDPAPHPSRNGSGSINTSAVQTQLDGSFTIPKVTPGEYYVVAYKSGYLSTLSTLPDDALQHPTKEDHQLIASVLPRITVQAGLPASIEVRLERGAAISGTVLFDDGSPASGLPVHVLVRRKNGQKETWSPLRSMPFNMMADVSTDDLGHYRLAGLEPREYIVEVVLQLQSMQFSFTPGEAGGGTAVNDVAKLSFYSGGVARKQDAQPFRVAASNEHSGKDMTIPLAKLHTVTGELTAAHDGHPLNQGEVKLLNPADKSELESTKIDRVDNKFHLLFVPEGDYILRVSSAADVTYEDKPNPPGWMPSVNEIVHTAWTYGTLDQPLTIHDDMPNLVVSVPDKNASQTAAGPQ